MVLGDEAFDLGPHGPSVAPDVADERDRDPVEDPVVGVLSAAVAPAPLEDAEQAGDRGEVAVSAAASRIGRVLA